MPAFRFDELPVAQPAPNTLRRHVHSDHLMLVAVDFVHGPSQAAPPHQHPHEQISYVVAGEVNFIVGEGTGQTVDHLKPGDMVVVPCSAPHTVEVLTESARLIDCFYPIRQDFL